MTVAPPIRVLLIEDDPADAGLATIALRQAGRFAVTHVWTLAEAVAIIPEAAPEVVLSDLSLPDAGGYEAVQGVRKAAPALPIIVLTGHDDPEFALKAVEFGAQDYLVKGELHGGILARAVRYAIARKELERRLRDAERWSRAIIEIAPDPLLVVDRGGAVVLANPAAERMFGEPQKAAQGRPLIDLLPDLELSALTANPEHPLREEGRGLRDGDAFPVELSATLLPDDPLGRGVVMVRDMSLRKQLESELRRLAATDALTGLPNRRVFLETAETELARFHRLHMPAAVIMLDIDHFKRVNDSRGHAAGDLALIALAQTLRRVIRNTDTPARLGGEEFAVLLPGAQIDGAGELAERLRVALAETSVGSFDGAFTFTVSLGVAAFEEGDERFESILRRADLALYQAKESGRNRVVVAPPSDPTS